MNGKEKTTKEQIKKNCLNEINKRVENKFTGNLEISVSQGTIVGLKAHETIKIK